MKDEHENLSLVLGGGGAHAAYQVGFLRCLADHNPDLQIPILTGISSGAINAAFIANHAGSFKETVDHLCNFWNNLSIDQVYAADAWNLSKNLLRLGAPLLTGGIPGTPSPKGLVDTAPLRRLLKMAFGAQSGVLRGTGEKIRLKGLKAIAITATNYSTGQAVTWVQGKDIPMWERPDRHGVMTEMTVDKIMASTALPILFPAVRIDDSWYGDGGIRQYAPLSPALHLGATRILAVSTRHRPSLKEIDGSASPDYPSIARIMDILMNAIFVDMLDQDLLGLDRVNRLLERESGKEASNLRLIRAFTLRPSANLGAIAGGSEPDLPRPFRFLTRGLGTHKTESFDWLSMIMFDHGYLKRLMEIGEADAYARKEEIATFLG